MKKKKVAIVNANLEFELPKDCVSQSDIDNFLHNVELPNEYVCGSMELVKVMDKEEQP